MAELNIRLQQLESRLQNLVEGGSAWLFPDSRKLPNLAHRLVEAMRQGLHEGTQGEALAPNLYILIAHPEHARLLQADPALLGELRHVLEVVGTEAGVVFVASPVVRIVAAEEIIPGDIQVLAQNSLQDLPQTSAIPVSSRDTSSLDAGEAFLIVDGTQIYPLSQSMVSIGRREDNQLVIDDPRVSRLHAQLRFVRGRFIIFDLGSTGGTFVNGQRIRECTLHPGDVISLAGISLVFGQDAQDQTETQDLPRLTNKEFDD